MLLLSICLSFGSVVVVNGVDPVEGPNLFHDFSPLSDLSIGYPGSHYFDTGEYGNGTEVQGPLNDDWNPPSKAESPLNPAHPLERRGLFPRATCITYLP